MSKRYGIVNIVSYALAITDEVNGEKPKNFKEALNNSDKSRWMAIMKEITLLKKNNIWILVKQPSNKRLVGCKWIFKLKERISSVELLRYKVT